MFMGNLPPAMGHIKAGRVRALAVTTAQRSDLVPELPTVAESGLPGFETVAWFGLFAPAGTPREVVQRVRDEVAKIVQQPEIVERIRALGGVPVGNSPEAFAAIVRSDIAKWKQVAKAANISAD
jgi:tripartite-type tricarboxylate transporter receptor subunit TctC